MTMRRAGPLVVATVLLAAACGIPAEDAPHPVQPPPGPFQGLATPAPAVTESGPLLETLYFTRDGKLIAVERRVTQEPTAQRLVEDVIAGPTDAERTAGVGTALSGAGVIDGVRVQDGQAIVSLGPALQAAGRNDQFLAFGQIVCTLHARADVTSVVFTLDGQVVAVPRGNGSLTKTPLTTADYEGLLKSD
jgi:sporulation and spore germination protein